MTFLSKLKCAVTSKVSLKEFYTKLSVKELKDRKSYHFSVFLTMSLVWILTFATIVWAASLDMPLTILYGGIVLSTIISLWVDYRKKVKLIDDLLKSR